MQDDAQIENSQLDEVPAITVWPSISAFAPGRWVGRMCAVQAGFGDFFTLGKLLAVATIPVTLVLYFWRVAPHAARRYTLTDRRVIIRQGLAGAEGPSIGLLEFDSIDLEVRPGQQFLRSADVVFRSAGKTVFRLAGVQNPETFRQVCLKARLSLASVAEVLHRQAAQAQESATTIATA